MDMMECIGSLALIVLLPVILMTWGAIGKGQRQWVTERDENRCQFRWYERGRWHQCKETKNLHCHHIYPQRANKTWTPHKDPHRPENLIMLCPKHHNGPKGIHPDMDRALQKYRKGNKDAFQEAMQERQVLANNGHTYWNTEHDLILQKTAKSRTSRFSKEKKYPEKRRRKGWKPPKRGAR